MLLAPTSAVRLLKKVWAGVLRGANVVIVGRAAGVDDVYSTTPCLAVNELVGGG